MQQRMYGHQHNNSKEWIFSTADDCAVMRRGGFTLFSLLEAKVDGKGVEKNVQLKNNGKEGAKKIKHLHEQVPVKSYIWPQACKAQSKRVIVRRVDRNGC